MAEKGRDILLVQHGRVALRMEEGIVKLPFVFIACAFANDTYPFHDHKKDFDPSVYAEPYTGLWRWLES